MDKDYKGHFTEQLEYIKALAGEGKLDVFFQHVGFIAAQRETTSALNRLVDQVSLLVEAVQGMENKEFVQISPTANKK